MTENKWVSLGLTYPTYRSEFYKTRRGTHRSYHISFSGLKDVMIRNRISWCTMASVASPRCDPWQPTEEKAVWSWAMIIVRRASRAKWPAVFLINLQNKAFFQGKQGSFWVPSIQRWWKWKAFHYWVVVSNIFYFQPYLGNWSNLTNIFQIGWNHQLENHKNTCKFLSLWRDFERILSLRSIAHIG